MAARLKKIAERKFVVQAEPDRVWELLGPALLNSPLGLEKIEVLDEEHVRAETRMKMGPFKMTTKLSVSFLEMVEPKKMVTGMEATALGGIIHLDQRVIFNLTPKDDKNTEVACEALAGSKVPLLFVLLASKAKSVAGTTLAGIEETLKRTA